MKFAPVFLYITSEVSSRSCRVNVPNNKEFYSNPCGIEFQQWLDAYHANYVECDGNWPKCTETGLYLPQQCYSSTDRFGKENKVCACTSQKTGEVLTFLREWGGRETLTPVSSEFFEDFDDRAICKRAETTLRRADKQCQERRSNCTESRRCLDCEPPSFDNFCRWRYRTREDRNAKGCVINGICKKCYQ